MRVIFFREQPDIVAETYQPLEQLFCVVAAAEQQVGIREPETAGEKRAFAGRQSVLRLAGVVAQHETVGEQLALDRLHGAAIARIIGLEESERREQQQARIEIM